MRRANDLRLAHARAFGYFSLIDRDEEALSLCQAKRQ